MIEDPDSLMFMAYVKCSSSLSVAKMHSIVNRHPGPISIYKENPLLVERLEKRIAALEKKLKEKST